jgi:hypothetical protein
MMMMMMMMMRRRRRRRRRVRVRFSAQPPRPTIIEPNQRYKSSGSLLYAPLTDRPRTWR